MKNTSYFILKALLVFKIFEDTLKTFDDLKNKQQKCIK